MVLEDQSRMTQSAVDWTLQGISDRMLSLVFVMLDVSITGVDVGDGKHVNKRRVGTAPGGPWGVAYLIQQDH